MEAVEAVAARLWAGDGMNPARAGSLALCCLVLGGAARPAQDAEALVREHMQVVRDRRIALDEKRAAMDALVELGTEGPRQLGARLAEEGAALAKARAKEEERLLEGFAARARRLVERRLDRTASKEVETLRARVVELARDPELAKETIVAESDPALERLAVLLSIGVDEVLEQEPELDERHARVLDRLADERVVSEYFGRCVAALDANREGARIAARLERPPDPTGAEERLADELAFRALCATPMEDADLRALRENRELAAQLEPEELAGNELLNTIRIRLGLRAVRTDLALTAASRGHSQDMHELGFFAHESPVEGKRSFTDRAALAGTSASAENISKGQRTGEGAIGAWWHSPGHHRNMLAGHGRVGLGRFDEHWTQLFGG